MTVLTDQPSTCVIANEPRLIQLTSDWIVVDKPSGWLSIPPTPLEKNERLKNSKALTPSNSIISKPATLKSDLNINFEPTPKTRPPVLSEWVQTHWGKVWIVHRLDIETSGVLMFARNAKAHTQANLWFEKRQIKKHYFCIAHGVAPLPIFKINTPIRSLSCLSQIQLIQQFNDCFLGKVWIKTGRRHQIRIHLSQSGYPLLGDLKYGGKRELHLKPISKSNDKNKDEAKIQAQRDQAFQIPQNFLKNENLQPNVNSTLIINRVALHAFSLELPNHEKFEANLPMDFRDWIKILDPTQSNP